MKIAVKIMCNYAEVVGFDSNLSRVCPKMMILQYCYIQVKLIMDTVN